MLMFISGAVLVIGVCIFLGTLFLRGTAQPAASSNIGTHRATDTNPFQNGTKPLPHVKPAPAAFRAARTFLETAVPRKNLAASYDIVGPFLKGGTTRAQWLSGAIPVTYVPATNLKTVKFDVKSSTRKALFMIVGLVAGKNSGVVPGLRSLGFQLEVDHLHGRWLVNYFMPDNPNGVRANPYTN